MESMIAVGLLAIVASTTVYAMMSSNRFAISQRYVSNAKALCQERIDQALISSFPPAANDTFFGNWAALIPGAETETPVENDVPIYTMAVDSTALVKGTRRTWITKFPSPATIDPAFVYARIKVRVEFWVAGRGLNNKLQGQAGALPYFFEMITLRAPD